MSSSAYHYFAETDPESIADVSAEDPDTDARPYDASGFYPEWDGPDTDALAEEYARAYGTDTDGIPLGIPYDPRACTLGHAVAGRYPIHRPND